MSEATYCECGKEIEVRYRDKCVRCREVYYLANAVWLDEIPDKDFMWCDSSDNYRHKDSPDEDAPYSFIANPDKWNGLDIEDALESSLEDYQYEGAEHPIDTLVDVDELKAYVKQWNAKQCVKTYFVPGKKYEAYIWDKTHPIVLAAMELRKEKK